MRRLSAAAALAVPLLLLGPTGQLNANPPPRGFDCGGYCFNLFRGIHQHGPLFNYGPYYGYYPFTPYGPWDQYLRYDPYFYGQPGPRVKAHGGHAWGSHLPGKGCHSCGFAHASWLHGGWFKGHNWLSGNKHAHSGTATCSSCGGVATPAPAQPNGCATLTDPTPFGSPVRTAAAFYGSTPTLNPLLDLPAPR